MGIEGETEAHGRELAQGQNWNPAQAPSWTVQSSQSCLLDICHSNRSGVRVGISMNDTQETHVLKVTVWSQ
jgi:hypothetical protein